MNGVTELSRSDQRRALWLSTTAVAASVAVWMIFAVIGVSLKATYGFSEIHFGILVATPILTGSISRIFFGIWTEQYGGRSVFTVQMLVSALAVALLTLADSYPMFLLAGLGVGLAGGAFVIGTTYVSHWFAKERQSSAVDIVGIGNVGAAVTQFAAPYVLVAYSWQTAAQIWAAALAVIAVLFWLTAKEDPANRQRRLAKRQRPSARLQLEPLRKQQVWRFSLYYFFVFGAFVALVLWLPHYLIEVYGLDIVTAGALAAAFALPATLFRRYGGQLSDRFGARSVMYWAFGFSLLCLFMLSYPPTEYVIRGAEGPIRFTTEMGLVPFAAAIFVLGFFMALGNAAIYRHIPFYYPDNVGAVGGLVGMIGGLGGFVLPIMFGVMLELTGIYTSCFALLFVIVAVATLWMHVSIRAMERDAVGVPLEQLPAFPELPGVAEGGQPPPSRVIEDWRPEDQEFWRTKGRRVAQRNLWLSIPCLLLAFSIWMVWSVVVAKLPTIGFDYATDELFWLAALPGLSGATLRIFYSFMVPIFGGRLWTTISTASLLIPALGIGYAVQDPETPYLIFLILALLCGFGGGNFASSMANISFFFPKSQKGNALALNAGLGNLGVSVMQFVVPLVITTGVFGVIGGEPQTLSPDGKLWLQNAGFVWVPFLIVATALAWLGMNDLADARASFREQAIIFQRRHNWIMCLLYTGTFGSFIGYSAGFPLLAQSQFPHIDSLRLVFLGPLVGALSRAATGWISDRWGGGRVTLWTFVFMTAAVGGVLFFLSIKEQPGAFWGFFAMFVFLFFATGVGNASTFQMIPVIMRDEIGRLMPELSRQNALRQSERESAAIIAFTSAIAAYGAFFIPKAYGTSIAITGDPAAALWAFLLFYLLCAVVTFWVYTRRGGLLHAIERRGGADASATVHTG